MVSILDQYQEASTRSFVSQQEPRSDEPIRTGYVDVSFDDEIPIFARRRVATEFPVRDLVQIAACNNLVAIAGQKNIFVINRLTAAEKNNKPEEVELNKSADDRIHRIFMSPSGSHLVVAMTSKETFYISMKAKKSKVMSKFKGHRVESIGWSREGETEHSTGSILVGTSEGSILEAEIQDAFDTRLRSSTFDVSVKEVFAIRDQAPVTGIQTGKTLKKDDNRHFILVTTPTRLYEFILKTSSAGEQPSFSSIFAQYKSQSARFLEIPGGTGSSELHLLHATSPDDSSRFAWTTGAGVYYGVIDGSGRAQRESVTVDTRLIEYTDKQGDVPMARSMVLTDFHVMIVLQGRVKVFSTISSHVVFEDAFSDEKYGRPVSVTRDPSNGLLWCLTDRFAFRYVVEREARDVWRLLADKHEFELAKRYCKESPAQLNQVHILQAEHSYSQNRFEESADLYAKAECSFEEVTLKFLALQDKVPLRIYLLRKLERLQVQEKTQITMLVTWIVELYLNHLGQLRDQKEVASTKYKMVQDGFRRFLEQPRVKDCVTLIRDTIYELIASHGDLEDFVHFATLMKDSAKVITHFMQQDEFERALQVLRTEGDAELYYKFSPALMSRIPGELVQAWTAMGKQLDPKRLIPALVHYDPEQNKKQGMEAIRYLEFCIDKLNNKDKVIHNYLLLLYATLKQEALLPYLHKQSKGDGVSYDPEYALRLCADRDLKEASVHIYASIGLYEEAVATALQFNVDLAKEHADLPGDDAERRKKLWLVIARHVVTARGDIQLAMAIVKQCELLKIEDILPFFPDFVTIDHFKDAICTSLEDYNKHIERLNTEMNDATTTANQIRDDINVFRNKHFIISGEEKCASCGVELLVRHFYLFPCGHMFHIDCLVSELSPLVSQAKRKAIERLQQTISDEPRQVTSSPARLETSKMSPVDQARTELDDILSAECVFCGEVMIRSIDKAFIEDSELDQVMKEWL